MENYLYKNTLIGKKQLRQLLAWSFSNYDSMQACELADELKYLGFKYASLAGISISIEDLKVPFIKSLMLKKANQEILNAEKIYLKGKITEVERFQKIIDTWNLTSEALKEQVIYYFKNYDPLNSVYIMAFSGARGNLSQVRQLVGMRGLMADPSGEIMKLPIKKNFREGLTITDYLISGYGARKGIVDTALKTANSGYLTRRLIDVSQDILIREKDCLTTHSFLLSINDLRPKSINLIYKKILGRILNKPILESVTNYQVASSNTQITSKLIERFRDLNIQKFSIRSSLTCNLYRAICQKCYGWDLANENLIDIGESIGILAGQSIGEPGTQLTMRTFHTGGIFTSETRKRIISPVNGIIKFYKLLQTILVRTNRGEDVLITKNSGSLVLMPENESQDLKEIEVLRNTILFPKNNQYILKDTVIGELINTDKKIKTDIKPILSQTCGEIVIPSLKKKINSLNNSKLIWILEGQLYNSPVNSFINFYTDYKLNRYNSIFRTKLINHYKGSVKVLNNKKTLYQKLIRIINAKSVLTNSNLQKLTTSVKTKNCLLNFQKFKYLLKIQKQNSRLYLQISQNQQLGLLLTNKFRTLTGGIIYYDYRNFLDFIERNKTILYSKPSNLAKEYKPVSYYRTIVWLGEEIHYVDCEPNLLLVERNDFISDGFELIPGLFSKTSGIVNIFQKNNLVQIISVKSGLVYEGKTLKGKADKLYYPGEIIFNNISIPHLSFCEHIVEKTIEQLLVRPIEIYEVPFFNNYQTIFQKNFNPLLNLKFELHGTYSYKSNQRINRQTSLNLISITLDSKLNLFKKQNLNIELFINSKNKSINFNVVEKVLLKNYILPTLRYKSLNSCFLLQPTQFLDKYVILGYLEALTEKALEIVKLKVKIKTSKQILLISNLDCFTLKKTKFPEKKLNDFILNSHNIHEIGKIIIENKNLFTLQKGRPYFFPNCKNETLINKINLQYKIISPTRFYSRIETKRNISLNYYNILKLCLTKFLNSIDSKSKGNDILFKSEFSKFFLKKNAKLYSSLIPQFFRKFSVGNSSQDLKWKKIIRPQNLEFPVLEKLDQTLLLESSGLKKNPYKSFFKSTYQLNLIKFLEYPFIKSTKSVGLYSITEDYFEQEVNSVFSRNSEFIENGEIIGLLNLEKEITGDIVQGLPKIEEILEARKKNLSIKRVPTNQKRGLLVQKTTLDPNFEFRKLGSTIKENDKINPHNLLKVYFNYYGLIKFFSCDLSKEIKYSRLISNYEGSYKSFKKVQLFILNSVQSVYQAQGVSINDKHLEVIIKQMTTKVLITYEGNTSLLRREIIDLYHIYDINQIVEKHGKQVACYVPLLLGITKAALNNPSFISAASFQETTRVLTKAAIEGQMDWLRGLKENVILGNLIPSGTGFQNYQNCFKTNLLVPSKVQTTFNVVYKD